MISIIIPTFNRPEVLESCLEAITSQAGPAYEVLVCDDGSEPPVRVPAGVRLIRVPHQGPAAARNAGAAAARGRFLVFLDDDCLVHPGWLAELSQALAEGTMVAGKTLNGYPDNVASEVGELILDVGLDLFRPGPGSLYFFRTTNLALSAADFRALGGFDPRFRTAEDRDLCYRWQAQGGRMLRVDSAIVSHRSYLTMRGFVRRHFAYGRGAFRFHRRTRLQSSLSLVYYLKVLQVIWTGPTPRIRGCVLFALWQLANLAGFFWEMVTSSRTPTDPRNAC